LNFPKVEIVLTKHQYDVCSYLYEKILFFKQKIRESIQRNFLPPQSSILEGTILGDNGAMTNDLKTKLNITGLRHIISVSGTHIVILSSIIMSLLLAVGLWRGQAFYIAMSFICFYIILTGLPASGIRAGIMGGLYLLAQKLGRQSMGSRVIVMACAGMLLINPLLLIYDVGFQLSFLAVMGLIYLEPFIKNLIKMITRDRAEELIGIISTTFAAQIFTLPIMIYNFGNISFIAPITNLLVLPIVYWLMVFGFLASMAGIFSSAIGWILSIPCWILLTYFVKVIDFFSKPWAMKTLQNIHWFWLIVFYLIVVSVTWFLRKKYSQKFIQ
jgi:competence protein ComEC